MGVLMFVTRLIFKKRLDSYLIDSVQFFIFQLVLSKLSAEPKIVKLLWVAYLSCFLPNLLYVSYLIIVSF